MKFSYNLLQKLVSKKLPEPHELVELLTMHSFEVEGIEKKDSDHVLDIDILPNRAHDAANHIGMAREAAALSGAKLKKQSLPAFKKHKSKAGSMEVSVENTGVCQRYMGAVIRGVEVKESPDWLKNTLENLGVNSINNIVDAANYAMLVTGQPLHAFDIDKISGEKIIIRNAKQGEAVTTLDEDAFILDPSMLVIADQKDALAIAGIKGGKKAEVEERTKDIFIESAWFEPASVRKTSGKLGLRTDASWRFEHEIPLSFPELGLLTGIELIQELAGGEALETVIDTLNKEIPSTKLSISPENTQRLLGVNLASSKISSLLGSVEFSVEDAQDKMLVSVPEFRLDIEREEDLIEEVGRLFGYENIDPEMPRIALYPPKRHLASYWKRQVKKYLSSRGFNEIYSYSFISDDDIKTWKFDKKDLLELANTLSEEYKYMAPSLLPNIAKAARENLKTYDRIEIFEASEVFSKRFKTVGNQELHLCMAVGAKDAKDPLFYEAKGYAEAFLNSLGISDVWFDDVLKKEEEKIFAQLHPSRRAFIKAGEDTLGIIGEIDPRIASSIKLKAPLAVAYLDLGRLIILAEEEEIYSPISNFPQAVRDISVLVPKTVKVDNVLNAINTAGGALLRDVDMFDHYQEDSSEEKSMAFHLIFQAEDRTLRSEEIDELMAKITHEIKDHEGWNIK